MTRIKIYIVTVLSSFCIYGISQDVPYLDTSKTTYLPVPVIDKPEYLEPIPDPTFGTKITRIVGNPGDPIPNVPGEVWASEQERHGYSKRSVWNCDQSMIYLDRHYPNLWLDGETYEVLFSKKKPGNRLRWSHTEPEIMYHLGKSGDHHVGKWNVVSNISTELIDLRAYSSCSWGEGEGNFTTDGTKASVYGKRISDGRYVVFVVDVVNKTKGPDFELDITDFDNCTMSPLGNYILINHGSDRLKVLDANTGSLVWEETEYGLPSHFDVQVDQNGDEVVVGVAKSAPYNGLVIKRKLSDGTTTPLTTSGYASHTSGRNLKRPGWVFVTYQNLSTNSKYLPYIGEMDAVKLDGTRVERICNLRVNKKLLPSEDQYYFEAHGCPSPDGLRVVFASDWDYGSYPIQAYVVDFRDSIFIIPDMTAPELSDVDSIMYQTESIEITSSEDGIIYLVTENTDKDLTSIRGVCIDSVAAIAGNVVTINISGLENGKYWLFARDGSDNISEYKEFTISGVGIENSFAGQIRIFPTPTRKLITLLVAESGEFSIEIISMNGQRILSREFTGKKYQVDLSSLQKGVYFITIRSRDLVTARKIIRL